VADPNIEAVGDRDADGEEEEDLGSDLAFADGTRGDGAIGLVDGIDVLVEEVVQRLGVAGEAGPAKSHGAEELGNVFRRVPLVVAASSSATSNAPDERDPRDGLGELQPDAPQVLILRCASDAKQLLVACRARLLVLSSVLL